MNKYTKIKLIPKGQGGLTATSNPGSDMMMAMFYQFLEEQNSPLIPPQFKPKSLNGSPFPEAKQELRIAGTSNKNYSSIANAMMGFNDPFKKLGDKLRYLPEKGMAENVAEEQKAETAAQTNASPATSEGINIGGGDAAADAGADAGGGDSDGGDGATGSGLGGILKSGFSPKSKFSRDMMGFAKSGLGSAITSGTEVLGSALGLKNTYQINNKMEGISSAAEQISKNFGNPLVNAATDFAAGGVGKLMGLNTGKVVGAGTGITNAASNVLSNFGPIGMAASAVLKVGNMAGGKNLEDFDVNARVQQSSGYTGSAKNIQETSDKYGGAMVGGVDRLLGNGRKYKRRIREQKRKQAQIKGILNESDRTLEAASNSADMFRTRNAMAMQDNSYLYNGVLAAKHGTRIKNILKLKRGKDKPEEIEEEQSCHEDKKMNIIPEGALHARKHHLEVEDITTKGIPIISEEEGGVVQHAEIERNEIIFTKEISDELEELWEEYNKKGLTKKEKDDIAIRAGEILTYEIIENTDDRTGLITTI